MQETQVPFLAEESYVFHGNYALAPQLKPTCPSTHALQQEKPVQWEACAPQRRVAPVHSS